MLSPDEVAGKASEAASFLRAALPAAPSMALVLGSGWDTLTVGSSASPMVAFESVPGFAPAGIEGHEGCIRLVETGGGRHMLVQEGRLHCYEGHSALEVAFPVWAYKVLGAKVLVMLSAAGGRTQGLLAQTCRLRRYGTLGFLRLEKNTRVEDCAGPYPGTRIVYALGRC